MGPNTKNSGTKYWFNLNSIVPKLSIIWNGRNSKLTKLQVGSENLPSTKENLKQWKLQTCASCVYPSFSVIPFCIWYCRGEPVRFYIELNLRCSARAFSEWDDFDGFKVRHAYILYYYLVSFLAIILFTQIYTSKHQLWSADLVYVKLYLSQVPFVSTCQTLTTDLLVGSWPVIFFA